MCTVQRCGAGLRPGGDTRHSSSSKRARDTHLGWHTTQRGGGIALDLASDKQLGAVACSLPPIGRRRVGVYLCGLVVTGRRLWWWCRGTSWLRRGRAGHGGYERDVSKWRATHPLIAALRPRHATLCAALTCTAAILQPRCNTNRHPPPYYIHPATHATQRIPHPPRRRRGQDPEQGGGGRAQTAHAHHQLLTDAGGGPGQPHHQHRAGAASSSSYLGVDICVTPPRVSAYPSRSCDPPRHPPTPPLQYEYVSNYPLFINMRELGVRLCCLSSHKVNTHVLNPFSLLAPHLPPHPHAAVTTFAYLPTSLLYIIPMMKYRPDVITPEARAVPQKGASCCARRYPSPVTARYYS